MGRSAFVLVVVAAGLCAAPSALADRNAPGRPKAPSAAKPPAAEKPAKPAAGPKDARPADSSLSKVLRDGVAVMSGPGSFHAKLGELARGDEVEVLSESGPWLEVQGPAARGFIPRSALETRSPGARSTAVPFGSSEASASSKTAALKGFNPEVEKAHARARGEDWSGLHWIDQQVTTPEQVESFLRARGLPKGRRS